MAVLAEELWRENLALAKASLTQASALITHYFFITAPSLRHKELSARFAC